MSIAHPSISRRPFSPSLLSASPLLAALLVACGSGDSSNQTVPSTGDASAEGNSDSAVDAPSDKPSSDAEGGSAASCQPNPCKEPHKTVCKALAGGALCVCDDGYKDDNGSCVADVHCQADSCHGHGTCSVVNDAISCACQQGWAGPTCSECDAVGGWHADGKGGCTQDPCVPDPCGGDPDLVCKVSAGKASCVCRPGTHEDNGDCVPDTTCQSNTCNGHGTCSDSGGKIVCACETGWTGAACDQCDTLGGWHQDGQGGCTQDVCTPNPCKEIHKNLCSDNGGTAKCSCDPGYHDEGGACLADDTCTASSCNAHGDCQVVGGKAVCACNPGYEGVACTQCAAGYHDDGAGGCTDNPCKPNPCLAPHQTQCLQNGLTYTCQCDAAAHPDGLGGCTTDPCKPDPCAAQNLACKNVGGAAQCYEPDCNDSNPCTTDTKVNGACHNDVVGNGTPCTTSACLVGQTCQSGACTGGSAANCSDGNPCTNDTCEPNTGCHNTIDSSLVPEDGYACTVDSCDAQGIAQHVASDPACDDALYCTGVEKCQPGAAGADAKGCVATAVPTPPAASACTTYGACVESTPHFVPSLEAVGTPCDDQIACTIGDTCQTGGVCQGTPVAGCLTASCVSTSNYSGTVAVPVSLLELTVALNGQPLPASASSNSETMYLFLRAADTGVLHEIRHLWYTSAGGPWPASGDHAWSLLPGLYDVLYRRGYTSSANVVSENPTGDVLPNGYRVLQTGVVVGAGNSTLAVDIPKSNLHVDLTLDGQPLPNASNSSSDTLYVYLRSADTGALHQVRHLWYTSAGGPWPATGDHADSILPGTYDVIYRRGHTSTGNLVSENPDNDLLPNGYRVLQQGLSVPPGSANLAIDVPTARLTGVNLTVNGSPLPTGSNPSSSTLGLYLRAKDTQALHQVRHLWYTSAGGPWPTGAPHAWSLVPGEYDVVYRRDWSSSSNEVAENVAGDKLPAGYRVLGSSVTLHSGDNALTVDVPVANIDAVNITLAGAPLPSGANSNSSTLYIFLRAHDTGVLHQVRHLWYTSAGGPWPATEDHAQSVPTGVYDVVYRRGWVSSNNTVEENDPADKLPNGYRVIQENVTLGSGANTLQVNVPVATLSDVSVLLDHAALPSGSNVSSDTAYFYLRAKDTGALHQIRHFWYTSAGGPWPSGGDHASSLVAGTYDLVFARGYTAGSNVSENLAQDKLPNGYRVLQQDVVLQPGANSLVVDLTQTNLEADITLAGNPLPTTSNPSSETLYLFLRSRDTETLHGLRHLWYTSAGGPWPANGAHAKSVPPGLYDLIYQRGYGTTDNLVGENVAQDKLPNGFRVLQRCLTLP